MTSKSCHTHSDVPWEDGIYYYYSYTAGRVPEPCGYAVLLLVSIIQKTVPCGRIKNYMLHSNLHILIQGHLPTITGRTGRKGGRAREREEGMGKADRLDSSGRWCSATLYHPNRCLRMNHRVRLAALIRSLKFLYCPVEISVRTHCERQRPSGHLL
jgi:hypothetical protein